MRIREEKDSDFNDIRRVNVSAFPTPAEADLVDKIRLAQIDYISLVAEYEGEIVGHILFSSVSLVSDESGFNVFGLGPMAVVPEHQKKGIGSRLIHAGLDMCTEQNYDAVVVLGHPEYYPRFGFVPSLTFGIASEYDVPSEVFMVKELKQGILRGLNGIIKYHKSFNEL